MKKKHRAIEPLFSPLLSYEEVMGTKCPDFDVVVSHLRMNRRDAIETLAHANTLLQSMLGDPRKSSLELIQSQLSHWEREMLRPFLNQRRPLLSAQALERALFRLTINECMAHCDGTQEYRYSLLQLILCANNDLISRIDPPIGELSETVATVTACQSEYVWSFNVFVHLYRAVHMIKELSSRESFHSYIRNHFVVETPKDAVKVIFTTLIRTLMHDEPSSRVYVPSQVEGVREVLDTRCVNLACADATKSFNDLRQFPLYRLGEGEYIVLSPTFLLQLLFSGTLFHYKRQNPPDASGKASNPSEELQLSLLRKVIRELYDKCSIYDGDELGQAGMVGSLPDAVIVNDRSIFIVELKSGLLNDTAKQSSSPDEFVSELVKKYVQDDKRNLGLLQAYSYQTNSLSGLLEANNHSLTDRECILLLVHDEPALIAPGVVDILEREYIKRGMPLEQGLVIHLNTLVHLATSQRNGSDDLLELVRRYRNYRNKGATPERLMSFDEFIQKKHRSRLSEAIVNELADALNFNPSTPT